MDILICLIIVFITYLFSIIDHYIAFKDLLKKINQKINDWEGGIDEKNTAWTGN